ncbi:MAG: DUF4424 domain-containing protein [Beijerinckiaceae bacterium]|nr:DUF4424 domain-containing protein [Beijerinckiaceae bacterium]
MRHAFTAIVLVGLSVLVPTTGYANDSSAEYATGGLRFTVEADIAMQSEDLFVSTSEVRVSYVFVNRGKADKTVLIAFPMPDITGSFDFTNAVPTENQDNPFDFHVKADGQPLALALDQHIIANGVDQTERLRKAHIPLMPAANETGKALDRLSAADKAEYLKLGLAMIDEYTDKPNAPMEKHLIGVWTLRAAFTWRQTFPAGREVRLEQTYKPSVGGSVGTLIGGKDWRKNAESAAYLGKYCIDSNVIASVTRAMERKKVDYPPFSEQRISYILKTGANWAGPIGSFHLVVDKGEADKLVSFCADGVTKIGPTQFEVRKTNFTPKQDLDILLLVPTAP